MNRTDIINKVKSSAIEVMQDRRILASLLISECILISEKYDEIINNNPLRLMNNRDEIIKFSSIEDCFNSFINSGIQSSRENIIGNYNYKSVIKLLKIGKENENSLIEIIESFRLHDLDKEIISNMYNGKRTIVEINNEPFIDCYRVRQAFGSDKTEVLVTFDKDEAINECKKYYGYSVFNSRGNAVFTNALTPELKAKMELKEKIVSVPQTGSKIYLKSTNLYQYPDSKSPIRSITGYFYMSDNKRYNNRFMITDKPEYVGNSNFILGYINAIKQ